MSKYVEKAKELRAIVTPHHSCSQSVLVPFAEEAGLTYEQAMRVASCFGGGMRTASVCGAVTGGLMALGLYGVDDPAIVVEFQERFRKAHSGMINCADLLAANAAAGREKKPHCDALVYECVALVEEILREQGKL